MNMTVNYTYELYFEQDFDPSPSTAWMKDYWHHSISFSLVYFISIFLGQYFMRSKRRPFDLQLPLAVWNSALAIFSILGTVRMLPEFSFVLANYGFHYSICNPSFAQGVTGFWTQMFAISKVLELVDTAFIVLRKRPLIFLHWYHHISVLIYTWHAYKDHTASGRWFVFMNYAVHALMYSYYALRALNVRLPKSVAMSVTVMQLSQMVIGCYIACTVYLLRLNGAQCQQTYSNLYFSFSIYFTYFCLFAQFFYTNYMTKNSKYSKIGAAKKMDKELDENGNATTNCTSQDSKVHNGFAANGHVLRRSSRMAS